jgi:hypothetical protein
MSEHQSKNFTVTVFNKDRQTARVNLLKSKERVLRTGAKKLTAVF